MTVFQLLMWFLFNICVCQVERDRYLDTVEVRMQRVTTTVRFQDVLNEFQGIDPKLFVPIFYILECRYMKEDSSGVPMLF